MNQLQHWLPAEQNLDLTRACELAQGMEVAGRNAKEIQAKAQAGLVHSVKGRAQRPQLPYTRCLGVGHAPQEMSTDVKKYGILLKLAKGRILQDTETKSWK